MRIIQPKHGIFEHRLLGQPLHLPRQVGDEEDVGVRLVVRNRHVGATGVTDEVAPHLELPERVELDGQDAEQAKEAPGSIPPLVEGGGEAEEDEGEGVAMMTSRTVSNHTQALSNCAMLERTQRMMRRTVGREGAEAAPGVWRNLASRG
jgi:hypothetical protein